MHDKIILFDATLLVQKKTQCRQVTLNKVLNNYGLGLDWEKYTSYGQKHFRETNDSLCKASTV